MISPKEVIATSRPAWWVNTALPYIIGFLTVNRGFSWQLVIGTIYFLLPYNLAMYGMNDIFGKTIQKEKRVSLGILIAIINIPFIAYLFLTGSCGANVWLLAMIFMTLAFSFTWPRFKEIPSLDAATAAFFYTAPFIYGIAYAGGFELWIPAYVTFFLWAMSNYTFRAIQNIATNRKAGVDSVATVLGAEKAVFLCLFGYIVAAMLPFVFYGWKGAVVSIILLPYIYVVTRTLPAKDNDQASLFRKNWELLIKVNYVAGTILVGYLISIAFKA